MNSRFHLTLLCLASLLAGCTQQEGHTTAYTRGLGQYPGCEAERYAPIPVVPKGYRNLALHRMAKASSNADFNQTAMLVTDGRKEHYAQFGSFWRSATADNEWICLDLGAMARFDRMLLTWLNAPDQARLEVSDDSRQWRTIMEHIDNIAQPTFSQPVETRYVRLNLESADNKLPYSLAEWEIWGEGGIDYAPAPNAPSQGQNLSLCGGDWRLQRADLVNQSGCEVSRAGFSTEGWIPATVPATILSSYYNIGAIPDANVADNQLQISEAFFNADFWYRREFTFQGSNSGEHTHLCFDGINWKADVYVNGTELGSIEGAFQRGDYDITSLLHEGLNTLAVRIHCNQHPGATKLQNAQTAQKNGGELGGDNPTFHASIGWDWLPTVRGRNIGIWNDVYLRRSGAVRLVDPFVQTLLPLPDTTMASVEIDVTVLNQEERSIQGILCGRYGAASFRHPITLQPGERRRVHLDPTICPELQLQHPQLWWPNGYGQPHLYEVELKFLPDNQVLDQHNFRSGVRQFTAEEVEIDRPADYVRGPYDTRQYGRLNLYINGRRFVGFGGNWGFPEANLNYRAREYDAAVAYHRDMNFTMIRNWVGQTGDEEFYDACDRYGIVVWQDFWLANPWDGPDPDNEAMFQANALDYVRRIRNHASIGLYVGRNEGNPPALIDSYLRQLVASEHPGMHYISHSATGVVSGGGPYNLHPTADYFHLWGADKMHSERGIPCVMNYENLTRAFGGTDHLWPINTVATPNDMYGLHDYTLSSAQRCSTFNDAIDRAFGFFSSQPPLADSLAQVRRFTQLAQWMNYSGYRAAFEGRAAHREGLLLWMSHPAWPSMVWQTYDYYLEPTAAYFACKKACEPIHIQWNPLIRQIEIVNYHAGAMAGLKAEATLYDIHGEEIWHRTSLHDVDDDSTLACFPLELPAGVSDVFYLRLRLWQGDKLLSQNFYCEGREAGDLRALCSLPQANVTCRTSLEQGETWQGTITLSNVSAVPALMLRLKLVGQPSGELILPVIYQDNYLSLMPGEERTVAFSFKHADTRGEQPAIMIEGFNL